MLYTVRTGLVDAFIAAGGMPPVGPPSVPASSAPAASCPVVGSGPLQLAAAGANGSTAARGSAAADSAVPDDNSRIAGAAHARAGAPSRTAAEHGAAGNSVAAHSAAHSAATGGTSQSAMGGSGPIKNLNPTFLLDEALRSMAGGNFAAARARLALCRSALLAQAGPDPTSDPNPASSPGAEGQAAVHHRCRGDAMPAAGAANDSAAELPSHGRGTANGQGGGGGVEPEVGGGRDALACQLGAVCGSLV